MNPLLKQLRAVAGAITPRVGLLAVLALTFAVYMQVSSFEFISFDDNFIYDNGIISKGFSLNGLWWCLTNTTYYDYWHPLPWISHMLDFELYGQHAGGHHLTGVMFHMLATVGVYLAFSTLMANGWAGVAIAGLFALHPVHTESVAWVVERKDVMSATFFFFMLYSHIQFRHNGRRSQFALTLVLYVLGLAAKPMLITAPFILLLIDFWLATESRCGLTVAARTFGRLTLEKAPFFVFAFSSAILTYMSVAERGLTDSLTSYPLLVRLENAVIAYVGYVWHLVYPADLALVYPFPEKIDHLSATGAFALLAIASALAIRWWRTRPAFIAGWLWYLGSLVPVIGIVKSGYQSMADRYAYLPAVGLYFAFVASMLALSERTKHGRYLLSALHLCILAALAMMTHSHLPVWRNNESIYAHSSAVTTRNVAMTLNMATTKMRAGQFSEAMRLLDHVLEIDSTHTLAHLNKGELFCQAGDYSAAYRSFENALRFEPYNPKTFLSLSRAKALGGDTATAISLAESTLVRYPQSWDVWSYAAELHQFVGNIPRARQIYCDAARYNPSSWKPWAGAGKLELYIGDLGAAERKFEMAMELDHKEASIRIDAATCAILQKQSARARRLLHEALAISPHNCEALAALAYACDTSIEPLCAREVLQDAREAGCDSIRTAGLVALLTLENCRDSIVPLHLKTLLGRRIAQDPTATKGATEATLGTTASEWRDGG